MSLCLLCSISLGDGSVATFHCVLNVANALVAKLNQTDITSHIVLLLSLVWVETVVRISASAKTGTRSARRNLLRSFGVVKATVIHRELSAA